MSSLTAGLVASPLPSQSSPTLDRIVFTGVFVFVAVAIFIGYRRSRKRSRAFAAFASAHGLAYLSRGDFRASGITMFGQGRSPRWRRVMMGMWAGSPITYSDFSYTTGSGKESRTYSYSVAFVPLDCRIPVVNISPHTLLQALAGRISGQSIDFESIDFNHRYMVTAEDRRFAFELIDARMMEALLSMGDDLHVVAGPAYLTVYRSLCEPAQLQVLLDEAVKLLQRVPDVVRHDFGSDGAAFGARAGPAANL